MQIIDRIKRSIVFNCVKLVIAMYMHQYLPTLYFFAIVHNTCFLFMETIIITIFTFTTRIALKFNSPPHDLLLLFQSHSDKLDLNRLELLPFCA
jgi:hypothetical protein